MVRRLLWTPYRIISLSWGAKKKESKNSDALCICVNIKHYLIKLPNIYTSISIQHVRADNILSFFSAYRGRATTLGQCDVRFGHPYPLRDAFIGKELFSLQMQVILCTCEVS
jgi:hypothetical protein